MSIPTLLLLSLQAVGESAASTGALESGPDLNRYLLISAGMILLVGGVGWFMQRTLAGSIRGRANKRSLRIIDVLPMGGKKKLAVVRIYDRTFALGLGDKEIAVVSELDTEATDIDSVRPTATAAAEQTLGGKTLVRAFEAIRTRVAEGIPRPQPKLTPAAKLTPAENKAGRKTAIRRQLQEALATKTVTPAKKKTATALGDGRGLLG